MLHQGLDAVVAKAAVVVAWAAVRAALARQLVEKAARKAHVVTVEQMEKHWGWKFQELGFCFRCVPAEAAASVA